MVDLIEETGLQKLNEVNVKDAHSAECSHQLSAIYDSGLTFLVRNNLSFGTLVANVHSLRLSHNDFDDFKDSSILNV